MNYQIRIKMKNGKEHIKEDAQSNNLPKAISDYAAWCVAPDDMHLIESITAIPKLTQVF